MTATSAVADRFRLSIPAEAAHVSTARLFVATVARALGADEDTVEDVKVGISEACSMALRGAEESSAVSITATTSDGSLRFEVEGAAPPDWLELNDGSDTPTPTSIAAVLSREVLATLFDDAEVAAAGDRSVVRFSVRTATR